MHMECQLLGPSMDHILTMVCLHVLTKQLRPRSFQACVNIIQGTMSVECVLFETIFQPCLTHVWPSSTWRPDKALIFQRLIQHVLRHMSLECILFKTIGRTCWSHFLCSFASRPPRTLNCSRLSQLGWRHISIKCFHLMWMKGIICMLFLGGPPLVGPLLEPGLCVSVSVCRQLAWTHNIFVPSWWNWIKLLGDIPLVFVH